MQNNNSKVKIFLVSRHCFSLCAFRFEFSRGFTLIEIIIATSILLFVSILGMAAFSSFKGSADISSAADTTLTYLIQARSKTLSAENGTHYGVHVESGKIVLYQGAVYVAGGPGNEEITIPKTVDFYSVSLNGGGNNILFKKLSGETDNYGTIGIRLKSDTSRMKTIIIRETGLATIE
ncbi:MAG: prepilin-type N-terminal cleavage/methylation domain-containing protein [bacterium]|nr:prepilin-type N-terminal cleavage/methylation domain-containing protein [bacterium]